VGASRGSVTAARFGAGATDGVASAGATPRSAPGPARDATTIQTMGLGMTTPVDGFSSTETFDSRLSFGVFFRRFVPMLVTELVVVTLMVGLLLGCTGIGALAFVVSLVLALILAAVMVTSKKHQFDETWGTTKLELSPAGATLANRYIRVQLAWDQIRHLGAAHLVVTREAGAPQGIGGGPVGRGAAVGGLLALLPALAARGGWLPALVGVASTTTVTQSIPKVVRGQLQQNDSCREVDPVTRRRMKAIVLPVFDEEWRTGRIGDWIRAYRPDLFTAQRQRPQR
jgi:hypothetical protein